MQVLDLVKEFLSFEGYRYEIDKDGDIHFKYQGLNLYCTCNGNDDQFFRIIVPGIYKVEGNRVKVLEAANEITKEMKVLKAFLVDDVLWLSIEMFLDSTPDVSDFFERCLNILYKGYTMSADKILGNR